MYRVMLWLLLILYMLLIPIVYCSSSLCLIAHCVLLLANGLYVIVCYSWFWSLCVAMLLIIFAHMHVLHVGHCSLCIIHVLFAAITHQFIMLFMLSI